MITLQETATSILLVDSLAGLTKQTTMRERLIEGKEHMRRAGSSPADSQRGTGPSVQQATELRPAQTHGSSDQILS